MIFASTLRDARPEPIEVRLEEAGLLTLRRLAWVEVDISVLAENARVLSELLGGAAALGIVVKADGYGHGLVGAAHAALVGGAALLIVATLDEALALRSAGFVARILVLYPVPPAAIECALAADLDLVAVDEGSVRELAGALRRAGTDAPWGRRSPRVHLGIDTGMSRGGVRPLHAAAAATMLFEGGLQSLAGVWSHLAAPENPSAVASQVAGFDTALKVLATAGIPPGARHLNATGGLFGAMSPPYDLVRVGLAFYGQLPSDLAVPPDCQAIAKRLRPALTVKTRAASIGTVSAGTAVGYGMDWVARRESVIATLPVGYADGWARLYGRSTGLVRGREVPLVGRVGSDAVAADVTDVEGFDGTDEVVLVGPPGQAALTIEDLARMRGSIPWEVLDAFATRLARVYVEDGKPVAVRYLDGAMATVTGFQFECAARPTRGPVRQQTFQASEAIRR